MTSRPIETSSAPTTGRPHLPPVGPSADGDTTSRRTHRKAPLAWLPWVLLGLLLLTLLGTALLAKAAGGSGDADRASSSTSASSDASSDGGAGGAAGEPSNAALNAGGKALVGLPADGLAPLQGQAAQGTARVESVVADEGFWVGSSPAERVFVFLTPEARRSAGESGFQVEAGQTVSLTGTVKASSPEFAGSAGVTDAEGARQLVQQGGYVEATAVRLAQ